MFIKNYIIQNLVIKQWTQNSVAIIKLHSFSSIFAFHWWSRFFFFVCFNNRITKKLFAKSCFVKRKYNKEFQLLINFTYYQPVWDESWQKISKNKFCEICRERCSVWHLLESSQTNIYLYILSLFQNFETP